MSTLGEISNIEYNITHGSLSAIKVLHSICFGNEGEPRKTRKSVRTFSGFKLNEDEEFLSKIKEISIKFTISDLIAICNILCLNYNGSNEELARRICSFLNKLEHEDDRDEEYDEDDKYEEDEDDDDDEDEEREKNNTRTEQKTTKNLQNKKDCFSLTFKDVEDSIRTFDGKDNYPIRRWVEDFEEVADITGWNELQKLIFAKKSLRGLAKLFVQSQKGIKTWSTLKRQLIEEFEEKISSAQIHKMLSNRKKRYDESVQEYVLTMREIGSRATIEMEVVIQYIIDGIQDDSANKIVLYGARNFAEFKEKIKLYESIVKGKTNASKQFKPRREFDKREERTESKSAVNKLSHQHKESKREEHCFNCGNRGHKARECPDKSKGAKCFKCNKFGHLSNQCIEQASTSRARDTPVTTIDVLPRNSLEVKFEKAKTKALFDTGSDISIVREDFYEDNLKDEQLFAEILTLSGIGDNKVKTLGMFSKTVDVNDEQFNIKFHVVPKDAVKFSVILGNDLLEQAEVHIDEDGITVCKRQKEQFLMKITIDQENIMEKNALDIGVEDPVYQKAVTKMIEDYKPEKTKETDIQMQILLKTEEPIYQRPRRLSEPDKQKVEEQISEWLKDGIIKESSSDFASPIVLVSKRDGSTRICCDYRKLNKNVIKDRFPLPLIEDVLDKLENAKVFSTIDLKNGFFHVDVEENSTKYTSFVTPTGQYEFLKCPFGLCNSPAVFQRFISHIFRPLTSRNIVVYYMDDIIIPSVDYEEGIQRLKMTLDIAKEYGLEIKKKKCQFLKTRVQFLGYNIEDGKIQPSEEKTAAIKRFSVPTTCKQLQSFLGLTGYFRKFIPSYSIIAKPLSDMLRKDVVLHFGEKQRWAFNKLKELLTTYPVLHIFQRDLPTEVHTDASKHGYGACLMQKSPEDSKLHPVYYLSKKTTPAEEKYTSYELEVLAIITALKKFRVYLLGTKFKIVTDCSAFQKTMQKKELTTRVARWALLLEEFEYEIEHRKGTKMAHVDALSRNPVVMLITEEDGLIHRIQKAQEKDEKILAIKSMLEQKDEHENYFEKHGLIYKYDQGKELLVVPKGLQTEIIRKIHEDGHFGIKKTEDMIKREFFIAKLKEKIQNVIESCIPCLLGNRKEGKQEGSLHPIPKIEGPLDTYHADHLGPIPSTNKNYQYILAVIDDFTKFTWLYATKSTTAKETVSCLMKQQKNFGNPRRIITDKGTAFTANEFKDYCAEENIKHVLITTGVPRGNGQIERIHRTVIPVLTKLSLGDPSKWYKYLDVVQRALNSTHQRSICSTPFEVLTGVKMRRKEDVRVNELIEEEAIKQINLDREEIRKLCKEHLFKAQEENKKGYNLRRKKAKQYSTGDLVAIKRTQFGAGLKVHRKFLGPYEVVKVKENERYDVVKIGNHEGPLRTSTCSEFMKPWVQNQSESES